MGLVGPIAGVIKQLETRGAVTTIGSIGHYGLGQITVTEAGKMYYHQLLEQKLKMPVPSQPIEIQESLEAFKAKHPDSSRTGFIMMKFGKTSTHNKILKAIKGTLALRGLVGVRSDEGEYHADLYWNVVTHLYGCGFGIAVFEQLEAKEFNPNVALEVGYMMALHKPICFLKDRSLRKSRKLPADLLGKLYKEFDSQNPYRSIAIELPKWLNDRKLGEPLYRRIKRNGSVAVDREEETDWWKYVDWSQFPDAYEKLPNDIKSKIEGSKR